MQLLPVESGDADLEPAREQHVGFVDHDGPVDNHVDGHTDNHVGGAADDDDRAVGLSVRLHLPVLE